MGVLHLLAASVVICKRPFPHGRIGKALLFQPVILRPEADGGGVVLVLVFCGSNIAGKLLDVVVSFGGQLRFQAFQFVIHQEHISIAAISSGGGVSRFSLFRFLSLSVRSAG